MSRKALSVSILFGSTVLLALWYLSLYRTHVSPLELREAPPAAVAPSETDGIVESHLLGSKLARTSFDGKAFVSFAEFGNAVKESSMVRYLWVLAQEYYSEAGQLREGTGASLPVAVTLKLRDGRYVVDDVEFPRDGAAYQDDVERIFPRSLRPKIFLDAQAQNARVDALKARNEANARKYFFLQAR